ncbi:hypothetical protein GCM10023193_38170 [Planotetraspora kaengkrachanensis]|uniref:Uncharacterized protein n=2 Tax=Planotetraspora kaengkrachanensis TaxID=575193 RepID=A0A8J3M4C4_9ACTN|nr:hypothetical protein Pka01_23360 [Planotetraspora kaengkrachanensis]
MDRHKWTDLGEGGIALSERIMEFISARDPDRVRELFFLIEEAVVPVNGPMRVGAEAVSACLVQGLLSATPSSRREILYLLFQLAGGVVDTPDSNLVHGVRRELELGFPIYGQIAEVGTSDERLQCIDLLSLCARFNKPCLDRATSLMRRIAEVGDREASTVSVELEDLRRDGYIP